ncbi:haloacid dehalogenase superfamily, subfamily IA, variant 3 with third motif having DD or ED [Agromyces sp. CF514]|uniref:HAD family hydrolase n=1 Tax=Agromyces sp. CF514 TaxID=1881031 RepID=UPI0008EF8BF0|nr:HAD family phosphatase [Agromyces sp. CF514]SFR77674.1 haloacid dehalogenase superfamily, subfamily IA, variant 3 with third motif having DD or ED [Agromyces sp. CF514]
MTTRLPAAVLWDMDGTIVDTEPYWMAAEEELVGSFGGTWTHDDAVQLVGSGLWESARIFQEHGVDLDADAIVAWLTERVREQLNEFGLPWRPGARELLEALRDASVPTALVTMSVRSMADDVIRAIPFHAFDAIVTGDSVTNAKPHPEPYLAAAAELGVDIAECVAFEDSPTGVASAAAAGAITVGVPNILSLDETPATVLWPSLHGRTVADVAALAHSRKASA